MSVVYVVLVPDMDERAIESIWTDQEDAQQAASELKAKGLVAYIETHELRGKR